MAIHELKLEQANLTGSFCRDDDPVLIVDSGDTVIFETLDAGWNLRAPEVPGGDAPKVEPRDPERDGGHCLCGPVRIRGAEPGMVLEIAIGEIRPGIWGRSYGGGSASSINTYMGIADRRCDVLWRLDAGTMTGTTQLGHTVQLQPFMGVMGMPPDLPGRHSTTPPRVTGGNLDLKELVTGTTLFLPIEVAGGLFAVGDGHGRQGDGDVSGNAIECPMERVELTFRLRDDMAIAVPRVRARNAWLTLGVDPDLHTAACQALEGMLDLICGQLEVERSYAIVLASAGVDMRITQLANGTLGVHAVLADGAIGSGQPS